MFFLYLYDIVYVIKQIYQKIKIFTKLQELKKLVWEELWPSIFYDYLKLVEPENMNTNAVSWKNIFSDGKL